MRGLTSGMEHAAKTAYPKAQMAAYKFQTSPLAEDLLFMAQTGLLQQGIGSNLLPLGTMAQKAPDLVRKALSR